MLVENRRNVILGCGSAPNLLTLGLRILHAAANPRPDDGKLQLGKDRRHLDERLTHRVNLTIAAIDSDADVLRREIENALYTQTTLVRSRGDIMRLFEKTRNIIDMLNDSLFQFEIETPFVPSELNPEFMKLTDFSTLSVEAVVPAVKAYFKTPETVLDEISRTYFYGKEAVKYSQSIKRTVFHNMPSLKLSEKFHLRYFALHIENLAKGAENVADQLAVMAMRRTF